MKHATDYLEVEAVSVAAMTLSMSGDTVDIEMADYFNNVVLGHARFAFPPPSPIDVLGTVIRRVSQKNHENAQPPPNEGFADDRNWALRFLTEAFGELRTIICGNRKAPAKLGVNSQATVTAVAAFIAHKLGVTDSTALGVAVLVLLSLGNASKAAFCRLTKPEKLKTLVNDNSGFRIPEGL